MADHSEKDIGGNPWFTTPDENDSNGSSTIAYPAPAATGILTSSSTNLRCSPPGPTPSRTASLHQTSPELPNSPLKLSPEIVSRAETQTNPASPPRQISPQRMSRNNLTNTPMFKAPPSTASTTASEASSRRRKPKKSLTFAEFFTGSSELVSSFNGTPKKQEFAASPINRRPSYTRSAASNLSSVAVNLFSRGRTSPSKSGVLTPKQRLAEDEQVDSEGFGNNHDEEFLNFQLDRELFPDSSPDFDGVSGTAEEAFEALLANAEKLFMRMQIAYQAKHEALMVVKERRKQDQEELEEAKERNEHLKSQIDTMGETVREQEDALQLTVAELQTEKELRRTDAVRRVRSVRIVPARNTAGRNAQGNDHDGRSSTDSSHEDSASDSGHGWSRPGSRSSGSVSTMPEDIEINSFDVGAFGAGLREENMRLKARVAELEETVDGCLGLVHNL